MNDILGHFEARNQRRDAAYLKRAAHHIANDRNAFLMRVLRGATVQQLEVVLAEKRGGDPPDADDMRDLHERSYEELSGGF